MFQLREFEAMPVEEGGLTAMEEELQLQSGAEEIKAGLHAIIETLTGEQGMSDVLRTELRELSKQAQQNSRIGTLLRRIQDLLDTAQDLSHEMLHFAEGIEPDPRRRQELEDKLDVVNRMMLKHGATDEASLIQIRQRLQDELDQWTSLDVEIEHLEQELVMIRTSLEKQARDLSKSRRAGAPKLADIVTRGLQDLSMKHAILNVEVSDSGMLHTFGADTVEFLFAANLGSALSPVKKVASGGEALPIESLPEIRCLRSHSAPDPRV